MEGAATLRRVQSLRNVTGDPSQGRPESRPRHGVLIRRKSVSELVARYQNVLDHHSGQQEEQVLDRNVLQTTKKDLLGQKSEDSQVQVNEDFARNTCVESFPLPKNSVTTINRNLQTTFNTAEINSKAHQKTPTGCTQQKQLFSGTKGCRTRPHIMSTKRPVTRRHEMTDSKYHIEAAISTQAHVKKQKDTVFSEENIIRKANEFPVRRLMEIRNRAGAPPGKLNSSTKPKNHKELQPHFDQLGGTGHIALQGQKTTIPSVKERSALYLSKAAAAYTLGPKKTRKPQEDIVHSLHHPQINKCQSVAREICPACFKPIYSMERMVVDKVVLHQSCLLCKHCKKKLSLHDYAVYRGDTYCKDHHALLTKAKEGSGERLKWKQPTEHQLIKPVMPNLLTPSGSQRSQEEKTQRENPERKKKLDPQYDGGVPSQIRQRWRDCINHLDSGSELRLRWPPLQNPSKDIKGNHDRPVMIQWPPLSGGSMWQTSKPTFIKLDGTVHKAQTRNTIAKKKAVETNNTLMTNAPFSKPDGKICSLERTGNGRRRLQQLTQKLKSHDGNIPRAQEARDLRKIGHDPVFQHTDSMLSNTSKVPIGSFPTHLKVLKFTKSTNHKPVTDVKRELGVSSAAKHTNVDYLPSLTPSSKNTQNTSNKHAVHSNILKGGSKPNLTADLSHSVLTPEKFKHNRGELDDCKNGSLDVQEESKVSTDQSPADKEEISNVSTLCKPVALVPTTQEQCGKTHRETMLMDEVVVSITGSQESETLNLSTAQDTLGIGIEAQMLDTGNIENNSYSYNKYLTQSETNAKARDVPLPDEESNGKETEKLKHSYILEFDRDDPKHVSQESPAEENPAVSVTDQNCPTSAHEVLCFQEIDSLLSNEMAHQKQILTGDSIMSQDIHVPTKPATSASLGTNLRTNASAVVKSDQSTSEKHITPPTREANQVLEANNVQGPVSQDITDSLKPNDIPLQSGHSLTSARKNATSASESRSKAQRSEVTSFTPKVKENRKGQGSKEPSLKSAGFSKNPFSRLFPSDGKDNKRKKDIPGDKRPSVSKPQSALGKIFALSPENLRKEKEQEEEVTKSSQKPSEGNSKTGEEQSCNNIGLDETKPTVMPPKEGVLEAPVRGGWPMQMENAGACLESNLDDGSCYATSQAGYEQIEGLPQVKNNPALESNELSLIPDCENLGHAGGAYKAADLPALTQAHFQWKTCQGPPCSESAHTRESLKDSLVQLEGDISLERTIPQIVPAIIKMTNTSPDRQETLQSQIQVAPTLSIEHEKCTVHTNLGLSQLRKEHQEGILHLDNLDLLEPKIPILSTPVKTSVLITDRNESGMYHQNIQSNVSAHMQTLQPGDQHCLYLAHAEPNCESTFQVNDMAPLFTLAPDLATATGTSSDIGDIHSFLNPELMKQNDARLQCEGDPNDPFGLGLWALNQTVDHVRLAGDNMESMSQSTLVNCNSENLAVDMISNFNSAAVAIESGSALFFLDDSEKQNRSS